MLTFILEEADDDDDGLDMEKKKLRICVYLFRVLAFDRTLLLSHPIPKPKPSRAEPKPKKPLSLSRLLQKRKARTAAATCNKTLFADTQGLTAFTSFAPTTAQHSTAREARCGREGEVNKATRRATKQRREAFRRCYLVLLPPLVRQRW